MSQSQEKRKSTRREIRRTVRAVTVHETRPSANCLLLDISESGARLNASDASTLPDAFLLVLDEGLQKWCRVVRRSGTEIGVQFIKTQRAANVFHEKRIKPRRAVDQAVKAVTLDDSRLAVDCTLLDISQSGGRLQSADVTSIPDEFMLVLNDNLHKWCKVVRRLKNEVGVRFVKPPTVTASA